MHVLILTNILWGVKFTQQPDCNTEQKKVLSYHFSANIYKKYYQRPQWGFELVILGAQWGQKLRNYLKKKSKLSYIIELIVSKLFWKAMSTLYNCN